MAETVRLGDSFVSLAERMLGDGSRWPEVEQANRLPDPWLLLFDQQVRLPRAAGQISSLTVTAPIRETGLRSAGPPAARPIPDRERARTREDRPALIPAHSYVFVVADEINPLRGKVIRRVITSPRPRRRSPSRSEDRSQSSRPPNASASAQADLIPTFRSAVTR